MKKYILILVMALFLSACTTNNNKENNSEENQGNNLEIDLIEGETDEEVVAEYRKITPEEAKEMMVEGNIILDVRTKEEYDQGYIEGAILLPVDNILAGDYDLIEDMNQTILVYCRSGNRSGVASKALVEAGYTGIYDFGGIVDWPYDIIKGD